MSHARGGARQRWRRGGLRGLVAPMTKEDAQVLWDHWDYEYEEEMGRA